MPLTKIVNGARVELTPAEEAIVQNEWATPEPVTRQPLTRTQIFLALYGGGYVTKEEAVAAVRRVSLPTAIDTVIAGLPSEQQAAAEVRAYGAETIALDDPLVDLIAAAFGIDPAAKLALWDAGLAL